MKQFLLRFVYPISIFIIGLAVLQVLNIMLQLGLQRLIFPDSRDYMSAAKDLFFYHQVHCNRALLMAFLTGFPYLFGSHDASIYDWSFILNVCCWLATALLFYEIARDFLQKKYAFLAALSSFFIVGNAVINYHLLTESIYVFWMMGGFFCLLRYYKTHRFCWLSSSLSIFLLSMLIKPGSKFLAIVFVLYFIRVIVMNFKHRAAFLMYFCLLLIGVQLVGIHAKYGDYKISYIDGATYYNYLFAKAEAYQNNVDYSTVKANRSDFIYKQTPLKREKIALNDGKEQLRYNTANVFKAYVSNVIDNTKMGSDAILTLENTTGNPSHETFKFFFLSFSKWQNRVFTLLGIVLASLFVIRRKAHELPYGFMGFFILYVVVLSGISSNQGDRFHIVVFPFVLILLSKWLADFHVRLKS